jgi:hypothetical protein
VKYIDITPEMLRAERLEAFKRHVRPLLMGAAAEAIHDAGMCDRQAEIVEAIECDPALRGVVWPDLSPAEAEVWRRVCEAP